MSLKKEFTFQPITSDKLSLGKFSESVSKDFHKTLVAEDKSDIFSIVQKININSNHDNPHLLTYKSFALEGDGDKLKFTVKISNMTKNLLSYLEEKKKRNEISSKREIVNILYQAAHALEYLHSKGIPHQNLKLQNIFIDYDNKYLLSDIAAPGTNFKTNTEDKLRYSPPEFYGQKAEPFSSDIWALGIILLEVVHRERLVPLSEIPKDQREDYIIKKCQRLMEIDKDLYEILLWMLQFRPAERPSFRHLKREIERKFSLFINEKLYSLHDLETEYKKSLETIRELTIAMNNQAERSRYVSSYSNEYMETTMDEFSDTSERSVSRGLSGGSQEAEAKMEAGKKLLKQANYKAAIEAYSLCLDFYKKRHGESDLKVAAAYDGLGMCFYMQGKYEEALENCSLALGINLKINGEKHPDTASSYDQQGVVYEKLGKYTLSLESHKKALNIRLQCFGEKHYHVAMSYNNIGNVYYSIRKFHESLENHLKSLEIKTDLFPADYVTVADSYNNIASIYESQEKFDLSLNNFSKALEIYKKHHKENHPAVANCYNNIGNIYERLNKYEESLINHTKALEIRKKALGENHVDVAMSYNNIGNVYDDLAKYPTALESYQTALDIMKKELREKHPYVSIIQKNIERVKQKLKK